MSSSTEASARAHSSSQSPSNEPPSQPIPPSIYPSSDQSSSGRPIMNAHPLAERGNSRLDGNQESWQEFLRQVAPQEIARRDPADPVRLAYVQNRYEEARRRRRAVTTSNSAASSSSQVLLQVDNQGPPGYESAGARKRPLSLQFQDRPLPRTPSFPSDELFTGGEHVVSRWQPDEEVSQCPICGRAFGIFFRRHHCRKCGRVVCASCSPHRITIPRQFIVRPPVELESSSPPRSEAPTVVDLVTGEDGAALSNSDSNPALGGGQEVRLCNPCVPDPNPLPPPAYLSPNGQHFLPTPRLGTGQPVMPSSTHSPRYGGPPPIAYLTHPRLQISSPPISSHPRQNIRQSWAGAPQGYSWMNGQSPSYSHPISRLRSPFGSAPSSSQLSNYPLPPPPNSAGPFGAHPRNALLPPTPSTPPPPPVREEDECPVCHSELPPKGPDGSETEREIHVVQCIESHFSTSVPRSAMPPPALAVAAAVAASAATPEQAGGPARANGGQNGAASSATAATEAEAAGGAIAVAAGQVAAATNTSVDTAARRISRRRTTGMVIYNASEKDCMGSDGAAQECVICFEEFAVGDEMGRLECLCKFHRACIRQWWDAKGAGACPVHQDGI